ncbi:MAG: hypothetical protein J6V11_00370, partial [Alphaproteobacteria bacterium]|nr:hypothetical protein [Alphaproteobacteria bacterium]
PGPRGRGIPPEGVRLTSGKKTKQKKRMHPQTKKRNPHQYKTVCQKIEYLAQEKFISKTL